ncbi:MAG: folate-binding protein [Methyloprofundus sp.]|nr:folate-binding protein [Methyloprofundus sp.]
MNKQMDTFLQAQEISETISDDNALSTAALSQLGILAISGSDAAAFLQGQTSCDISALKENMPQLGAYCNAKGRTISSFIIIKKTNNIFHLILSGDLIATVQKKLQMYVLRSDVTLTDQSESLCILGLYNYKKENKENFYPYLNESNRCLFIADTNTCQQLISDLILHENAQLISINAWRGLDILAGIPWLNSSTSELFVPQMINLDKLGAISFEKGCYTGQEVVARTHYLGKNKRIMLLASCSAEAVLPNICPIIDQSDTSTILGTVVSSSQQKQKTLLQIVLKEQPMAAANLQLNNENHDAITIL